LGWGVPHAQNPVGLPPSLSLPRKGGGNDATTAFERASIRVRAMLNFLAKRLLQL